MGQYGKHRTLVRPALAAFLAGLLPVPGLAACRLALLLALDVSSSVDMREDALQRQGLAWALLEPDIVAAILEHDGTVALAVYEWSGRYNQTMVLDWTMLTDWASVERAAARISASERAHSNLPTSAGYALSYAVTVFQRAPRCDFYTLDVSGDGINNDGYGPALVHRNERLAGVTVNGLAIGGSGAGDNHVLHFYEREVIYGPGAFVIQARNYDDYARAIRRKLFRELTPAQLSAVEE